MRTNWAVEREHTLLPFQKFQDLGPTGGGTSPYTER